MRTNELKTGSRRRALRAVLGACLLPFLPQKAALARTPAESLPKISDERPPIEGTLGKTYFACGIGFPSEQFTTVWGGYDVYLDDRVVMNSCFEIDFVGGWVGVYWDRYNGEPMKTEWVWEDDINPDTGAIVKVKVPHRVPRKRWVWGSLRIVQRVQAPYRTKIVKGEDGSLSFKLVLDRDDFHKELDRLDAVPTLMRRG